MPLRLSGLVVGRPAVADRHHQQPPARQHLAAPDLPPAARSPGTASRPAPPVPAAPAATATAPAAPRVSGASRRYLQRHPPRSRPHPPAPPPPRTPPRPHPHPPRAPRPGRGGQPRPVPLPLERIGGQVHPPAPPRPPNTAGPVHRDTADEHLRRRGQQPVQAALIPAQRPHHCACLAGIHCAYLAGILKPSGRTGWAGKIPCGAGTGLLQRPADRRHQHRMRADLDEHRVPGPGQRPDHVGEPHRLPQVREPVRRIQPRRVGQPAGHRRLERHPARLRADPGQRLRQLGLDLVDLRGMRGVIHRQPPHPRALRLRRRSQRLQRLPRSRTAPPDPGRSPPPGPRPSAPARRSRRGLLDPRRPTASCPDPPAPPGPGCAAPPSGRRPPATGHPPHTPPRSHPDCAPPPPPGSPPATATPRPAPPSPPTAPAAPRRPGPAAPGRPCPRSTCATGQSTCGCSAAAHSPSRSANAGHESVSPAAIPAHWPPCPANTNTTLPPPAGPAVR